MLFGGEVDPRAGTGARNLVFEHETGGLQEKLLRVHGRAFSRTLTDKRFSVGAPTLKSAVGRREDRPRPLRERSGCSLLSFQFRPAAERSTSTSRRCSAAPTSPPDF
jgi:hypothetical protein